MGALNPAQSSGGGATPAVVPFQYRSGNWYSQPKSSTGAGTNAGSAWLSFTPVQVWKEITIDQLGIRVTTAGEAGSYVVAGIYSSTNGRPDALLGQTAFASGQMSGASTGDKNLPLVGGPLTLQPGLYWFAIGVSFTTTTPVLSGTSGNDLINVGVVGASTPGGVLVTGVTNAYRNTTGFTPGSTMPAAAGTLVEVSSTVPSAAFRIA